MRRIELSTCGKRLSSDQSPEVLGQIGVLCLSIELDSNFAIQVAWQGIIAIRVILTPDSVERRGGGPCQNGEFLAEIGMERELASRVTRNDCVSRETVTTGIALEKCELTLELQARFFSLRGDGQGPMDCYIQMNLRFTFS